jgi:hypothetical protein
MVAVSVFPFAGLHLRRGPTVKGNAAHQLDVVGNHVPHQLLPRDRDFPAHQAPARVLHYGEGLGKEVVEGLVERCVAGLVNGLDPGGQRLPLLDLQRLGALLPERRDLVLELADLLGNVAPELVGLRPQLLVGEGLELGEILVDLVHEGLHLAHLAVVLVTQQLLQKVFHGSQLYSFASSMIRRTSSGTR